MILSVDWMFSSGLVLLCFCFVFLLYLYNFQIFGWYYVMM